jgi:hypothetical protein
MGISTLSPGSIQGAARRHRRGRGETTAWPCGRQDRVGVPLAMSCENPPGHLYQKVGQLASKSGSLLPTGKKPGISGVGGAADASRAAHRLHREKRSHPVSSPHPKLKADSGGYPGPTAGSQLIARAGGGAPWPAGKARPGYEIWRRDACSRPCQIHAKVKWWTG